MTPAGAQPIFCRGKAGCGARELPRMKLLFCGDPHGQIQFAVDGAIQSGADVLVLLGDIEPVCPLHVLVEPILASAIKVLWIPGNHDADSDEMWFRVWGSDLAHANLHARVEELMDGTRIAGLGGVSREEVWHPTGASARRGEPAFLSPSAHADATPRQHRWRGTGPHRKHWGTIYPDQLNSLSDQRADILVTHEAPGYHPHGFDLLDDLARAMGAKVVIHGHHHDAIDSSARWHKQGFRSYGVGLRGLSLLDTATWSWSVVKAGDRDMERVDRRHW